MRRGNGRSPDTGRLAPMPSCVPLFLGSDDTAAKGSRKLPNIHPHNTPVF